MEIDDQDLGFYNCLCGQTQNSALEILYRISHNVTHSVEIMVTLATRILRSWDFLVVQWSRIRLAMQGGGFNPAGKTKVPQASEQLSRYTVSTELACHNQGPMHCNERSCMMQLRPDTAK